MRLSYPTISLPSYREFQRIISTALRQEENRLCQHLLNLSADAIQGTKAILDKSGEFHLTHFIALPKDVSNKELLKELERLQEVKELYQYACDFLPKLSISSESIRYYSSLVKYYGRAKLCRMNTPLVKLYLLCYIYHRCQRIHDNLVEIFQALVSYYHTKASQKAKEYLSELKSSFESEEYNLADIL